MPRALPTRQPKAARRADHPSFFRQKKNKGGQLFINGRDRCELRCLALSKKDRYSGLFYLQTLWNILASQESVSDRCELRCLALSKKDRCSGLFYLQALWNILASQESEATAASLDA